MQDSAAGYCPRNPEQTVLYGVVAEQLETFLARQQGRDRSVPRFVERELRSFLGCGIPAHGFLRVHCDSCGQDRVVPFSCKGRGFCPACGGRHMADTAAHLVDRVLPWVPVRQWLLSLPFALRYCLAYDARMLGDVLHIFSGAVFEALRRRARDLRGVRKAQCGAVTFIQRFGGGLNLNVHFHMLALDGRPKTPALQQSHDPLSRAGGNPGHLGIFGWSACGACGSRTSCRIGNFLRARIQRGRAGDAHVPSQFPPPAGGFPSLQVRLPGESRI